MRTRPTLQQIISRKKSGKKIVMLTAYDYPMAHWLDMAGIDLILVGDSLANVVLGLDSTRDVGMREMIYHAKAVRRAVKNSPVIGDMPYEAYQIHQKDTVKNAKRFIHEAGCDAVKIEWFDGCIDAVQKMIKAGIPVMGHVGLTPQTADRLGGFKVQGKDASAAQKIIKRAAQLEQVGCFSIVLECIPREIAKIITEILKIPTIGIGAGPFCDGQVLVSYDLLGLFNRYQPKFVKPYAHLGENIVKTVQRFSSDVRRGKFPDTKHSFTMPSVELKTLIKETKE